MGQSEWNALMKLVARNYRRVHEIRMLVTSSLLLAAILLCSFEVPAQSNLPRPDHIIIVIEENHSFKQIIDNEDAPYINSLSEQGVLFTAFFALHHPSQPNYLEFFSGSQQGVTDDSCPWVFRAPSFGGELIKGGLSFRGYAEDLRSVGSTVCSFKDIGYVRRHAPWVNFKDVPSQFNLPFTQFLSDFNQLPTVAFVIPNLKHDMHEGGVNRADRWLRIHLDPYVQWAKTHNSLLILTWDEDDRERPHNTSPPLNRIATILAGQMVKPGVKVSTLYTHLNLLRTLEEMYGLSLLGRSKNVQPISEDIWLRSTSARQPRLSGHAYHK